MKVIQLARNWLKKTKWVIIQGNIHLAVYNPGIFNNLKSTFIHPGIRELIYYSD